MLSPSLNGLQPFQITRPRGDMSAEVMVCGKCLGKTDDNHDCPNKCPDAVISMSESDRRALLLASRGNESMRKSSVIAVAYAAASVAYHNTSIPFVIYPPANGEKHTMVTVCAECLEIIETRASWCKARCNSLSLYLCKTDLDILLKNRETISSEKDKADVADAPIAVADAPAPTSAPTSAPVVSAAADTIQDLNEKEVEAAFRAYFQKESDIKPLNNVMLEARKIGIKGGRFTRLVLCFAYYHSMFLYKTDVDTAVALLQEGISDLCGADLSWEIFGQLLGFNWITKEQALIYAVHHDELTITLMLLKDKKNLQPDIINEAFVIACGNDFNNYYVAIELARHLTGDPSAGIIAAWTAKEYYLAKVLIGFFNPTVQQLKKIFDAAVSKLGSRIDDQKHRTLMCLCASYTGTVGMEETFGTNELHEIIAMLQLLISK
jgi:hypothetical protein